MKIKEVKNLTDEDKNNIQNFIEILDELLKIHLEAYNMDESLLFRDEIVSIYEHKYAEKYSHARCIYKELNQNVNNKHIKKLLKYINKKGYFNNNTYYDKFPFYGDPDNELHKLVEKCFVTSY